VYTLCEVGKGDWGATRARALARLASPGRAGPGRGVGVGVGVGAARRGTARCGAVRCGRWDALGVQV